MAGAGGKQLLILGSCFTLLLCVSSKVVVGTRTYHQNFLSSLAHLLPLLLRELI